MNFILNLFKKIPVKFRFIAYVILGFGSVLSFFSINSAMADKHHLNGFFIVLGIILAALVLIISIAANNENKQ